MSTAVTIRGRDGYPPLVVLYLAIGRRVGASARSYQRLQTISSSKFIAHARSIFQALVIPWLLMEQRAGEGWNKPVKEKDMMITGGNQETRVPAARHGDHEHRRYQEHALALRGAGSQACGKVTKHVDHREIESCGHSMTENRFLGRRVSPTEK